MRIIRNIKLALVSLTLAAGLSYGFALPVAAQGAAGQAKTDVCAGITAGGGTCDDNGAGFTNVIKLVIQILSVVAGLAAVIMIVIGGLKYVTSGGDSSKVASAKNNILYAIIGLVVVALAQFIVRYVLATATKA